MRALSRGPEESVSDQLDMFQYGQATHMKATVLQSQLAGQLRRVQRALRTQLSADRPVKATHAGDERP